VDIGIIGDSFMKIILSTWKPWTNVSVTLQQRVDMALLTQAEICIKGSNSSYLYGVDSWNMFKVYPYKGKSNDDFERLCKANGVKVQLWDFPYLRYAAGSARAVNDSIARWNPADVWLDIEGSYAKNYPGSTGPFLRSLGVAPVRYWLQSYRRPDLHPEILWLKWLKYKDPAGKYIIHGLGPQAYPIKSTDWVADFKRMVDEYDKLCAAAGRPDMPWFPTLPTFTEWGWTPLLKDIVIGVDYLRVRLGERLIGINFWRQDFLFKPEYAGILAYIGTLYEPDEQPTPERNDWFTNIDAWCLGEGGPVFRPMPPEYLE
jgi:hypothetical protein